MKERSALEEQLERRTQERDAAEKKSTESYNLSLELAAKLNAVEKMLEEALRAVRKECRQPTERPDYDHRTLPES